MATNLLKLPKRADDGGDEIFTLDEAAQFLKVKKRMLYDRVQRNSIPHLRAGKLIRFSKTALLDWMNQEAIARH
jgi:excisionase family DNA binding protein